MANRNQVSAGRRRSRRRGTSFGRVQFSLSVTQVDPLDISFTFANNITGTPVEVYNAAWSSTVINPNPPGPATRPFDFRFPLETPYFYNPAEGNLLLRHNLGNARSRSEWLGQI